MTTIERAIAAFVTTIEEARAIGHNGRSAEVADLLRHARELLDIVDEELVSLNGRATVELAGLASAMRERLATVEGAMITLH